MAEEEQLLPRCGWVRRGRSAQQMIGAVITHVRAGDLAAEVFPAAIFDLKGHLNW
ncbi:hypothetical protein [Streptomyces sp. NTH33]|uniref:hypothetical protein n=1 Tax=Streptomyces sp. NTH33 TaxID=1735453 RepID=UPI0015E8B02C|nr:hypothetical protein [Streptomyces sp. NTH33]